MDFITGLLNKFKQHNSIMVIVDKLSKGTHFIPIKYTYKVVNIDDIFMKKPFRLPKVVISDRDVKFTGKFLKSLFKGLGTQINFSTTYQLQTDRQIERVNQILEDMI